MTTSSNRTKWQAAVADFWHGKGKFWADIARVALDETRARAAVETVRVAAVVLVLPDGTRHLDRAWLDEDEEHAFALAESSAREDASALAPGECLRVELREVLLAATRVVGLHDVDERISAWAARYAERGDDRHLDDARATDLTLLLCQNVLILPDGERRVVSEQLEVGGGEGLRLATDLHSRLRRQRSLLRPGERLAVAFNECSLDSTRLVREGAVVEAAVAPSAARRGGARHNRKNARCLDERP